MKNKWIFLFVVAIFGLLFIFSNDLMLLISEHKLNEVTKVAWPESIPYSGDLNFKVENVNVNDDIFHSVEIRGWAFTPGKATVVDNPVQLYLISDKNSYVIDSLAMDRPDLKVSFLDNDVAGIQYGFFSTFTPLKIHDGSYQLWLHFVQGENEYFVDTELRLEKVLKSLEPINQPPK